MIVAQNLKNEANELQGTLFDGDYAALPSDLGYRGPVAQKAAGISYRQLDYWARTKLVEPGIRSAGGSGTQRLYSFQDILMLRVVKRLLDIGISLQQVRVAINHLRERGINDLTEVTLLSDGITIFECTTANEIYDLAKGGQGMFMIAIGGVWKDIEGTLAQLPAERPDQNIEISQLDELSRRRQSRAS